MDEKRLIRGVTLWQPHAWAIAESTKRVENRGWAPPERLIGHYLAIHAGKTVSAEAIADINEVLGIPCPREHVTSAIVAIAVLDGVEMEPRGDDPWFNGPVGWYLRDVVAIKPVPCKGRQGLWEIPDDILVEVRREYRVARRAA
jgi:hypothetical protein